MFATDPLWSLASQCMHCLLHFLYRSWHFFFHILVSCISPRNLLVRAGRFGNDNVSMSVKLARAYVAFKRFISEKKISCSQPEFTEGMASGPRFEFWVLKIYAVICHSGLFVSCFIGCAYLCCFSFVCIYVGYRFISCQLGCVITSFLSCFFAPLPLTKLTDLLLGWILHWWIDCFFVLYYFCRFVGVVCRLHVCLKYFMMVYVCTFRLTGLSTMDVWWSLVLQW